MLIQFNEGKYKVESVSEYSNGYWCRYLMAIPSRVTQQPTLS